jgi:hypothetical protein
MFADAYEIAIKFTSPLIISMRYYDKTVTCHIGSFVLLNDEGWVITAAHLLNPYFEFIEHQKEIGKFENNVAQIENNKKLNRKQKRKKISKLDKNQKWITNNSYWWGSEKYQIPEFAILQEGDIAIGRIEGYKHEDDIKYPIFMDPTKMRFGTSLCKLGYPYHQVKASYDDANKKFKLAPGTLPIPRFPIEGIYTREISLGKPKNDKYEIMFIETSSPGLRGQSGGPIFDQQGNIWGIQSGTSHFPLGFNPKVLRDGKEIEENQFLNVGWGVHSNLIIDFLKDNGVNITVSE